MGIQETTSNSVKINELITRYALAQRNFPKGIGIDKTLAIKDSILLKFDCVGKNLIDLRHEVLERIVLDIIKEYKTLKKRFIR